MFLQPIHYNEQIEKRIAKTISDFFYTELFKPMFDIIKLSNKVYNAQTDEIQSAIIQGKIYFQNNAFYSKTGRFSNKLAKELEDIGAKYSKYRKAYLLDKNKLNANILWAIDTEKARTQTTVNALVEFLMMRTGELPKLADNIVFGDIVNAMFLDLQKRLYADAKKHKIALISPKLDDFRLQEIHKRYVDNLHFWIKNFTEKETVEMREHILNMVLDGKSTNSIADYIQQRFGVNKRKALFLARNENAIATTSYLIAKYKEEGFAYFYWHCSNNERVRPLHRELAKTKGNKYGINGTNVFAFDNPPIIDLKTGERGYPGDAYNCHCSLSPYVDKELFKRRHELYLQREKQVIQ